jgi:hypothetical protein
VEVGQHRRRRALFRKESAQGLTWTVPVIVIVCTLQ